MAGWLVDAVQQTRLPGWVTEGSAALPVTTTGQHTGLCWVDALECGAWNHIPAVILGVTRVTRPDIFYTRNIFFCCVNCKATYTHQLHGQQDLIVQLQAHIYLFQNSIRAALAWSESTANMC